MDVGGFVVVVLFMVDFEEVVVAFEVAVAFEVEVDFDVVEVVAVFEVVEVVVNLEVVEEVLCEIGAPCPVPGTRYQFSSGS